MSRHRHRFIAIAITIATSVTIILSCTRTRTPVTDSLGVQPFDVHGAWAVGENGIVVCEDSIAARVGVAALRQGGNAVDAVVATAFMLAVTMPEAGNLGGGGFLIAHSPARGETWALDFRETAPSAVHPHMYVELDRAGLTKPSLLGAIAGGIPGTVAGLHKALEFGGSGQFSWAQLTQVAIWPALGGFTVGPRLHRILRDKAEDLARFESTRRVFFRGDRPLRMGERLVQSDLASSLGALQTGGPESFYRGWLAETMCNAVREAGGIWTLEDLKNYEPVFREPVSIRIPGRDDVEILAMPPPSSGGVVLAHTLALLEAQKAFALPKHGVRRVAAVIEALRLAFVVRNEHLGDPLQMKLSVDSLLSEVFIAALAEKLRESPPGKSSDLAPASMHESGNTTHIAVMDKYGGAASLTFTLNANLGSKWVIPGTGILLNNQMDDFDARPGQPNLYGLVGTGVNQVTPGMRMLSSMCPVIVMKDDKPWIVLGSRGGPRIITSMLQVLLRRIVDDADLFDTISASRIHHQWLPDHVWFEEVAQDSTLRRALEQIGYETATRRDIGKVMAAERLPDGRFLGVRDPRANGLALPVNP
jgi:gamma-glutamyltranspeptidase/glutathione hydrolase